MRRIHKGTLAKTDIPALAASCDLACLVDVGPDTAKKVSAAGVTLLGYCKTSGVRGPAAKGGQDAEWSAAEKAGLLWTMPDGTPVTQAQNGWTYTRVQDRPADCYELIVKPRIAAMLASAPGCYAGVLMDNATWQDPSLFAPSLPPDFDAHAFHDGTLATLALLRDDFPGLLIGANGYCGGAPAGLRGEALASTIPAGSPGAGERVADLCWFEHLRFKASGKRQSDARFQQDLGYYIGLANAGLVCVWDEPSQALGSAGMSESLSGYLAAESRVAARENCIVSVGGPPWGEWVKAA